MAWFLSSDFELQHRITEPTRVTPTSSTLNDNIIVDETGYAISSGVIESNLSHHL